MPATPIASIFLIVPALLSSKFCQHRRYGVAGSLSC
ncbi:Uncharacterised protein [Vibrio cholerae]|nr:Uncharacterised protein [Vibrio cholerae]